MFGILSLSTEIIFGAIAFLTLVMLVIGWNAFSGKKFRHVFGRVFLIIFIQIFILASVGIGLNRYGEFYASWGELLGTKSNLAAIATRTSALKLLSAKDTRKAEHTPGGSLIFKEVITGEKSGISDYVFVVTSPKLTKELETGKTPTIGNSYQVVELFPGFPGVPQTWIGALGLVKHIESLESQGRILPTLAIIPAINVVRGVDTECLNVPSVADVEDWLTVDMHAFATNFLGLDQRKWSTFGFSTGGWCAAEIAIRHPELYSQGVSLAGYYNPSFAKGISRKTRDALTREYDIAKTALNQPVNPRLMLIYSPKDRFSYQSTKKFLSTVGTSIQTSLVAIPSGGHNIKAWKPYVATGLEWLAQGVS
jgi:hypothetical protein